MKKYFLSFLIILSVCCKENISNNQIPMDNEEANNYEIKVELIENNDFSKDQFLKNQMNDYMEAMFSNDLDRVLDYCYPDMFIWMKKEYPDLIKNNEDLKKVFLEPMKELNKINKEGVIKATFEVGEITKRLCSKDNITMIYLIENSITMKEKLTEVKKGDENVAISIDKGVNWTFMIKDEEMTREILRYKFSHESINKLLN